MAGVRLDQLRKSFGRQVVVDIEALAVRDGEFFSLLGPSGCGKTTLLRLVAGLTEADAGRVVIGERDATALPTARRNLGMVFQNYALFPHLTAGENVAYGLRERGVSAPEIRARVSESLELVALADLADRYPHQLSGGQQQRVALARAVVYRPDVLLLDEPLSSLDVKLRVSMRAELKRVQQTIGITTIFVTHDQHEALALSDRVGVMREGRLEQLGSPEEIYHAPATAFVGDFVGGTNMFPDVAGGADLAVKPECVRLDASGVDRAASVAPFVSYQGRVESIAFLGSAYSYVVRIDNRRIEARTPHPVLAGGRPIAEGEPVVVSFDSGDARTIAR